MVNPIDFVKKIKYELSQLRQIKLYDINSLFNKEYGILMEYFIRIINYLKLLKKFSKLFPARIDKNLIIFGSMMGLGFTDNSKYFYQYLKKHSKYKLIWFTRSRDLLNKLKNDGINSIFSYSIKGIKILRSSSYVFVSWGMVDILPIKFSSKTILVHLRHGNCLKKDLIVNDKDLYNLVVSPSKEISPLIASAQTINPSIIAITGLPRNDILFNNNKNFRIKLKKKYKIPENIKNIILYAPTFRDNILETKFSLSQKELKELENFLITSNSILLIKGHFNEKRLKFKILRNVKIVNKYADIQELIIISDLLISDYSSVILDFYLILKPVILFVYDLDVFLKSRGIYYTIDELAIGSVVKTGQELINSLKTRQNWIPDYKKKIISFRKKFWNHFDGNSSLRLAKVLNLKLKNQ